MKLATALFTFAMAASNIASANRLNPEAPLQVTCTQVDGSVQTVNVMRLIYDSANGKVVGMGFGPNRGDEGFYVLNGTCEIVLAPAFKANSH